MNFNYKKQVILLAAWVLVVILIFKIIDDRQIASLIAGAGFVLIPGFFLIVEFKNKKNIIHLSAIIFFLVCSAVPIFLFRILNWGVEFNSLNFYGISAESLHRASNLFYLLLVVSAIYHWRRKK